MQAHLKTAQATTRPKFLIELAKLIHFLPSTTKVSVRLFNYLDSEVLLTTPIMQRFHWRKRFFDENRRQSD